MDKEVLQNKIRTVYSLATLPEIYNKISVLIDDPKTSADTLASVISRDETLTAKVLRIANSPFYKTYPEKITSLTFAVALLGFNATKNLILSASIFDMFQGFEDRFKLIIKDFWTHSITCGVASKIIAQVINYITPEEMFVAGLLHDIGKVVELQFMPEEFRKIIELMNEKDIFMNDAELKVLKYTHTYTGKLLAKHWNLSDKIIDCIEFHHEPEFVYKGTLAQHQTRVFIIHLANVFSHTIELGAKIPPFNEEICEMIQLKVNMVESILYQLEKESQDAVSYLFSEKTMT